MAPIRSIHASILLSLVLGVLGHAEDEMAAHGGQSHDQETSGPYPMTYFTLGDHQFAMQAHVVLMILSWIIVLPIGNSSSIHVLRPRPLLTHDCSNNVIPC